MRTFDLPDNARRSVTARSGARSFPLYTDDCEVRNVYVDEYGTMVIVLRDTSRLRRGRDFMVKLSPSAILPALHQILHDRQPGTHEAILEELRSRDIL